MTTNYQISPFQFSILTGQSNCICLPKVYYKITRKCEFEELQNRCAERLKVDLAETFFCKLLVPTMILYYELINRIWLEASFFAEHIAFRGEEKLVQTLFFASFLFLIDVLARWPFNLYRQMLFEDQRDSPSLFDCLIGDVCMKYPQALELPKHFFWTLGYACPKLQSSSLGLFPALWVIETAFLAVTYEVTERLVDLLALAAIPNDILQEERHNLDFSALKTYCTADNMVKAKVYIFRNMIALPMTIFRLPLNTEELMSVSLRYLALVEVNCIAAWRLLERFQGAFLYYLLHALGSIDKIMPALGMRSDDPVVVQWIIIDIFIYPVFKTILTAIRHYCNYRTEFLADAKTKHLGYDVALEGAIGKLGMFQQRFPIEDCLYGLIYQRTPSAVHRIEALRKCPAL